MPSSPDTEFHRRVFAKAFSARTEEGKTLNKQHHKVVAENRRAPHPASEKGEPDKQQIQQRYHNFCKICTMNHEPPTNARTAKYTRTSKIRTLTLNFDQIRKIPAVSAISKNPTGSLGEHRQSAKNSRKHNVFSFCFVFRKRIRMRYQMPKKIKG